MGHASVRLRPATSQARRAQLAGFTFQMTPVPEPNTAISCFPLGKNVPQPPASEPGSGAPISLRVARLQRRMLPSVLVVIRRSWVGSKDSERMVPI